MHVLFRILLVLGLVFIGLAAGTYLGGHFLVPAGSGLAGGPMALGYGLLGALITGILGIVPAVRLSGKKLARVALLVGTVAVFLLAGLTARFRQVQRARMDPDSAYQGLAGFSVSLEQIVIVDPYLSTRTELDSQRRRWATTLPDGRHCRGTLSANAH